MRENPWHLRRTQVTHDQWFRNLVDFHALTTGWLKELQIDRAPYVISRGYDKEVAHDIWMLDSPSDLESLLDDTSAGDLLARLSHTVWSVQAWTLSALHEKTQSTELKALTSVLEQASWKLGRKCGLERWPGQSPDIRLAILALKDIPFSGYPNSEGFLVKRVTSREAEIELRTCPHRSPYLEVLPVADGLCSLHTHWIKGFAYALNSQASIETSSAETRCTQRWRLL